MANVQMEEEYVVKIRDESFPKSEITDLILKLSSNRLTARDLISERVRAECDRRLLDNDGKIAPRLIQPGEKEQALNSPSPANISNLSDQSVATALRAFENNGFMLLVQDRQIEELDEEVNITPETVVTFLRLTPLVGG